MKNFFTITAIAAVMIAGGCGNVSQVIRVETTTIQMQPSQTKQKRLMVAEHFIDPGPIERPNETPAADVVVPKEKVWPPEELRGKLCPIYVIPAMPNPPELPYKELESLSPDDDEGLNRIMRHHIDELRAYVSRARAINRSAQNEYVAACREFLAKDVAHR